MPARRVVRPRERRMRPAASLGTRRQRPLGRRRHSPFRSRWLPPCLDVGCSSYLRRPFEVGERWQIVPFAELFSLFIATLPARITLTNLALLPVPSAEAQLGNVLNVCTDAACTSTQPITSINQLRLCGRGLGDFFGPGTAVGIPSPPVRLARQLLGGRPGRRHSVGDARSPPPITTSLRVLAGI